LLVVSWGNFGDSPNSDNQAMDNLLIPFNKGK